MLLVLPKPTMIVINPQSHRSFSCPVFDLTTWYLLPNEFLIIQFFSTFNPFFSPPLLPASLVSLTFPLLTHSVTLLMTSHSALLTQWPTYTVKERACAQLEDRKGESRDWGWWCSIQCALNRAVSGGAELKRGGREDWKGYGEEDEAAGWGEGLSVHIVVKQLWWTQTQNSQRQ